MSNESESNAKDIKLQHECRTIFVDSATQCGGEATTATGDRRTSSATLEDLPLTSKHNRGMKKSISDGHYSHEELEPFTVAIAAPPSPTGAADNYSSRSSMSSICRICHCETSEDAPLMSPCYCTGSLGFVHQKCLQQWIKSSQTRSCEVCRYAFIMESRVKPITKWEKLDMSNMEKRKVLCSVTFHIIAITCVVWSLYVLVERIASEVTTHNLGWPFWTKLVVVAIGFTGGLVFMYVQCKMYVSLFRRWKAYNNTILIQNCPENGNLKGGKLVTSGEIAEKLRKTRENSIELDKMEV